jgi:hypothetical protein
MNLRMLYDVTDVKNPDGSDSCYLLRFEKGQIVEVRSQPYRGV